jgi:hypothetical protein
MGAALAGLPLSPWRARAALLLPAAGALRIVSIAVAAGTALDVVVVVTRLAGALALATQVARPRRTSLALVHDRATDAGVRAALVWLALAAALRAVETIAPLAGWTPPSLLDDAARHALAIGFLAQIILASLLRLGPSLGGTVPALPRGSGAGLLLLNLGAAMRLAEVVAPLSPEWMLRVSAASGVTAWVGIAVLAVASAFGSGPRRSLE